MGDTITDPDIRIFQHWHALTFGSTKNTWLTKTPRRLSKPLELREGLVLQSSIRRYNRL